MNKTSEQLGSLFEALSKAQGKIRGAVKDAKNPFFKSQYATLHECWNAIREPLAENGLSIVQTIEEEHGKLYLRSVLGHSSGQYISSLMPILLAKQDPQSLGSATSYSRRYSLCALVGLSQMDDDGEAAMTSYRNDPPKEEKSMSVDDFYEKMGFADTDFDEVYSYLNQLEVTKKVPMQKIMEQALTMKDRFKESFVAWRDS